MNEDKITIEMTEEEAALFRTFIEHQAIFKTMLSARVFDVPFGVATLSFHAGALQSVKVEQVTYRK